MIICGIDPGIKGGIVFLNEKAKILEKSVMPPDATSLYNYLKQAFAYLKFQSDDIRVYLEKAQAFRGNGAQTVFNYGTHYGEIRGVLNSLENDYILIPPQTWTRVLHTEFKHLATAKEKSLKACSKYFPIREFIATPRSVKPHEGLIDAALIAYYGLLKERERASS